MYPIRPFRSLLAKRRFPNQLYVLMCRRVSPILPVETEVYLLSISVIRMLPTSKVYFAQKIFIRKIYVSLGIGLLLPVRKLMGWAF